MTDNTSPVATLSAKLPKGNGLSRAVPTLFPQRGALVPFVGMMRVEEAGLDLNDVQHLKGSIQRFELAFGPAAADAKDLITICSTAATSVDGQGSLFDVNSEDDEQRRSLVRDLLEWGAEQDPPLDLGGITDLWNTWHGGHYDARIDHPKTPVRYLREFAISKEAIAEDPVLAPAFSDNGDGEPTEPQDGDETPDESS